MIVDQRGNPLSIEGRRRMGFMGGDLLIDHETAYSVTPPERSYMLEPRDETLTMKSDK